MVEVEAKFLIEDAREFEAALGLWTASAIRMEFYQKDEYFNHPCRDFTETDEAFRIRISNDEILLTYKGPRLDQLTKTREEFELPVAQKATEKTHSNLRSILHALGFRSAGTVCKTRTSYPVQFEEQAIIVSIDQVNGLPRYAELEITCHESDRTAATESIMRFAASLGLTRNERRSYLELLGF